MKLTKLLIGVLVVLSLSFVWLTFNPVLKKLNAPTRPMPVETKQPTQPPARVSKETQEPTFTETGNLVFDDNKWFLLYEEPGAPALNLELIVTEKTTCDLGTDFTGCDLNRVKSGARVKVTGVREGNKLRVTKLVSK